MDRISQKELISFTKHILCGFKPKVNTVDDWCTTGTVESEQESVVILTLSILERGFFNTLLRELLYTYTFSRTIYRP